MAKFEVIAMANVEVRFVVDAEDSDQANEKVDDLAKQIKIGLNGLPVVPPHLPVTISWPVRDMWDWDAANEITDEHEEG